MNFIKFLTSKTFLKQIGLAVLALVVLSFLLLKWLNVKTNHGEFETVPDLMGKPVEVAKIELKDNNLRMVVQDSTNYNPDYDPYAVIEQEPVSGSQVKEDRKIYLTLNPSGYRNVMVPDLKGKTYRQAKPTLEALGFQVGKITYVDYLGKDEVVQVRHNGQTVNQGTQLPKTSKIDLVLGNGKRASSE